MNRLLMVSWLFPPHASIGAKRAWRFARHLPENGWAPPVLCRRHPPASVYDASDWSLPREVTVSATYDAGWMSALGPRGGAPADRLSNEPTMRRTLRARLAASPLMDGARFTRAIESIYRRLWQRCCEQDAGRHG